MMFHVEHRFSQDSFCCFTWNTLQHYRCKLVFHVELELLCGRLMFHVERYSRIEEVSCRELTTPSTGPFDLRFRKACGPKSLNSRPTDAERHLERSSSTRKRKVPRETSFEPLWIPEN